MSTTIYWAGPLFTQGERVWNRCCATALRSKGYLVVLPQEEAKAIGTNPKAIAEHCYRQAVHCDVMVAVLDGADSDSGTSVEVGLRIGHFRSRNLRSATIGLRTDFRASEDEHLNAMFRLLDKVIMLPSAVNEEVAAVVEAIDQSIRELLDEPESPQPPKTLGGNE